MLQKRSSWREFERCVGQDILKNISKMATRLEIPFPVNFEQDMTKVTRENLQNVLDETKKQFGAKSSAYSEVRRQNMQWTFVSYHFHSRSASTAA